MFCPTGILPNFVCGFFPLIPLLQGELVDALPNVMIFTYRAQIALRQRLEMRIGMDSSGKA